MGLKMVPRAAFRITTLLVCKIPFLSSLKKSRRATADKRLQNWSHTFYDCHHYVAEILTIRRKTPTNQ